MVLAFFCKDMNYEIMNIQYQKKQHNMQGNYMQLQNYVISR